MNIHEDGGKNQPHLGVPHLFSGKFSSFLFSLLSMQLYYFIFFVVNVIMKGVLNF